MADGQLIRIGILTVSDGLRADIVVTTGGTLGVQDGLEVLDPLLPRTVALLCGERAPHLSPSASTARPGSGGGGS